MRIVAVAILAFAGGSVGSCARDTAEVQVTVASVPAPDAVVTLLPVNDGTLPPDVDPTLPPDALFGGDFCSALDAADLRASGAGSLDSANGSDGDSCTYLLGDGSLVVVEGITADEFDAVEPGSGVTTLDGIGDAAIGLDRGATYEVMVRSGEHYFAVTAPDDGSAPVLARRAAGHVSPGAGT